MAKRSVIIVFVHGWSVINTDTYGGLPARLRNEAKARNIDMQIKHLYLGRYISFHDEVRIALLTQQVVRLSGTGGSASTVALSVVASAR